MGQGLTLRPDSRETYLKVPEGIPCYVLATALERPLWRTSTVPRPDWGKYIRSTMISIGDDIQQTIILQASTSML